MALIEVAPSCTSHDASTVKHPAQIRGGPPLGKRQGFIAGQNLETPRGLMPASGVTLQRARRSKTHGGNAEVGGLVAVFPAGCGYDVGVSWTRRRAQKWFRCQQNTLPDPSTISSNILQKAPFSRNSQIISHLRRSADLGACLGCQAPSKSHPGIGLPSAAQADEVGSEETPRDTVGLRHQYGACMSMSLFEQAD